MKKGLVINNLEITSWAEALSQGWGAVSANELLSVDSVHWGLMNLAPRKGGNELLPPPCEQECIAFAAIERSLKYGKSIAVTIPMSEHTLSRLVVFLHRLRLDAMQGGIRSPWLNAGTSFARKDVVCVARPSAAIKALSVVPNVGAYVLKNTSPIKNSLDKQQGTTPLIDGALGVMDIIEIIEPRTRPLVFIIDGTRGGYEKASEIDFALYECFPNTPRIVLLSNGDEPAADRLRKSRSSTHLWITRLSDTAAVYHGAKTASFRLDVVNDDVASGHLTQIGNELFALRTLNEKIKDPVLKEKLQALNKVCRTLGELAQPLHHLETVLTDRTRPGLFPVRCLGRWLEIASNKTCKYGEQQVQVNGVIERLLALHKILLSPSTVTGKAGYLESKVMQAIASGRSLCILVGTRHEADSMETWFDSILPSGWDAPEKSIVTVIAMDGVTAFRRQKKGFCNDVIVLGMPWANRLHWLSIPCEAVSLVCYSHEQNWYQKTMRQWWLSAGALSRLDGDKFQLWTLHWTNKLADLETDPASELNLAQQLHQNVGRYPVEEKVLSVAIITTVDDWLEALIKDATESVSVSDALGASNEFALIKTEKNISPLLWAVHRSILVLEKDGIVHRLPEDLREGDQIILLKNSDERVATQESLFDLLLESEGMRQLSRVAKQWEDIVDQVNVKHKGRLSEIEKLLAREGVAIGEGAIKGWLDHRVLGPQNSSVIFIFAKFLKLDNADNRAKLISNAIIKIRSLHQQLGKQLRKALIEGISTSSSIQLGDLIINRALLDEMIEVQTVVSVGMPDNEIQRASPAVESLKTIMEDAEKSFSGKLLFTTPALKSLRDCGFVDFGIFKTCITLMATELHNFYSTKETRMHSLVEVFGAAEIEYQPKMSAVSRGKYSDGRQYKNKPADINKHFKLGSGRDPKHTMRIHFDWDEEDQLIVIHHAGRHLEDSLS